MCLTHLPGLLYYVTIFCAGQDLLKFQQQYSEVVRNQATITVKITKCTTIGPPRMGKTCFKHLITGQEWDVEAGTASTDIMEAPEWVECYSLEDGGADKPWKLLSAEQQQGELIRAVHTLTITGTHLTTTTSDVQHPAIPSDIPTTTSPSDAHHVSTTSDAQHPTTPSDVRAIDAPTTTSPSDVQQSVIIPSDTPTTSPSDAQQSMAPDDAQTTTSPNDPQHPTTSYVTQTTTTPSDAQHSFTPSDVPLRTKPDAAQKPATVWQALEALAGAVKPKAVQDFLKDSAGKVLGETRLIHFVDTGGQSVYHDVHPVLITSPSVYVVVFNLHDLYQKSNEEQLQYFRSDLIQRPLRSIYTFGTKNPQEKHLRVSPEGPTIFIVGTHLDKIPEKDRKGILSTLHVMISTEIGNKPYRQFVRYDTEGQSFWAVDNTLAGREQEEEVKKSFKYISALRLMVQNRSLEMSVDIPLPWMLLKVVMEGKGVRYCKYSELMEVACERGYVRETSPEADLDSMLRLFHILSLFYHKVPKGYKKEDSLVFIHPDCLYSVTSDFLMAAKEEVKENCEERCQLQAAVMAMNDSQGDSEQRLNQALAANEEDTEDSRGSSEEKQQSQAATKDLTATKEDICYGAQLAEGIMVGKEMILERMRGNMKIIEQERVKMVQKVEGIMARLGQESTEVVLERLYAELIEIGQKYKLPSMECPDASSQEAKRQLFVSRLVNSLASSVRAVLCDPERKGDVLQVRKEVAKAMESMKTQCQRRFIDNRDMDQLLAILSDLRIVAQLNDSSSLVIPAALPEVPHSMDIVGTVDPLLVTVVSQTVLQVCYLPSGLFCCLISELVTGLHWTVVPLGRTHVAFTHKDLTGRVHVTEYESYIKIDLESQAALEELSETCQNVREMIHESIVRVYSNLLSDPTAGPAFEESLIWGFQCEEHPGDDTHIAAFYEDDDKFDCCAKCLNDMESFAVQGVKPEQLVWFSS